MLQTKLQNDKTKLPMISITRLKNHMVAYPETPLRTTALEQRI